VSWRVVLVGAAGQDVVVDQVLEPLGEHLAGDVEFGDEGVEAVVAAGDLAQDEQVPPVADDGGAVGDAAGVVVGSVAGHSRILPDGVGVLYRCTTP
jgi:hypothetical protein